jgi:hypothetical protein
MPRLPPTLAAGFPVRTGRVLRCGVRVARGRGFGGVGRIALQASAEFGDLLAEGGQKFGLGLQLGFQRDAAGAGGNGRAHIPMES